MALSQAATSCSTKRLQNFSRGSPWLGAGLAGARRHGAESYAREEVTTNSGNSSGRFAPGKQRIASAKLMVAALIADGARLRPSPPARGRRCICGDPT